LTHFFFFITQQHKKDCSNNKMKQVIPNLLVALIFYGALSAPLLAADISIVGNWSEVVNSSNLTAGAGSVLRSPIESSTSVAVINISNTGGSSWAVKVKKTDLLWPTGTSLAVKRTADGSGFGSIFGGTTYLGLTGNEQIIFSGAGDRSDIRIQLKLSGLSVDNPPDNYSTSITYRIE
jgi:hypothetical protein